MGRRRGPAPKAPNEDPPISTPNCLDLLLWSLELVRRSMLPDGGCLFRALADLLFGNQEEHTKCRAAVVEQLRSDLPLYLEFLGGTDSEEGQIANYMHYVKKMELADTWGDNVCLQAAADKFGVSIRVIRTDAADTLVTPRNEQSERMLDICYDRDRQHYDSTARIHGKGATGGAAAQVDTKRHVSNPGTNLSASAKPFLSKVLSQVTQVRGAIAHDDAKHTQQDDSRGATAHDEAKQPHQGDVLARIKQAFHCMVSSAAVGTSSDMLSDSSGSAPVTTGDTSYGPSTGTSLHDVIPSTGTSLQDVPATEAPLVSSGSDRAVGPSAGTSLHDVIPSTGALLQDVPATEAPLVSSGSDRAVGPSAGTSLHDVIPSTDALPQVVPTTEAPLCTPLQGVTSAEALSMTASGDNAGQMRPSTAPNATRGRRDRTYLCKTSVYATTTGTLRRQDGYDNDMFAGRQPRPARPAAAGTGNAAETGLNTGTSLEGAPSTEVPLVSSGTDRAVQAVPDTLTSHLTQRRLMKEDIARQCFTENPGEHSASQGRPLEHPTESEPSYHPFPALLPGGSEAYYSARAEHARRRYEEELAAREMSRAKWETNRKLAAAARTALRTRHTNVSGLTKKENHCAELERRRPSPPEPDDRRSRRSRQWIPGKHATGYGQHNTKTLRDRALVTGDSNVKIALYEWQNRGLSNRK